MLKRSRSVHELGMIKETEACAIPLNVPTEYSHINEVHKANRAIMEFIYSTAFERDKTLAPV